MMMVVGGKGEKIFVNFASFHLTLKKNNWNEHSDSFFSLWYKEYGGKWCLLWKARDF